MNIESSVDVLGQIHSHKNYAAFCQANHQKVVVCVVFSLEIQLI